MPVMPDAAVFAACPHDQAHATARDRAFYKPVHPDDDVRLCSRQKNPAVISSPSRPVCKALLADRRILLREATKRSNLHRKNRAIVLKISTSGESDETTSKKAFAIAATALSLVGRSRPARRWIALLISRVGVEMFSCKTENGFIVVSKLFRRLREPAKRGQGPAGGVPAPPMA